MQQLMFEDAGSYAWREAAEPEIDAPEQALSARYWWHVATSTWRSQKAGCRCRPDTQSVTKASARSSPSGKRYSGVAVGDRVVIPFQISCGQCRECRRGVTGSCGALPLMAMYGMAPLAGLDGGGFMADLVLVPYADAMLVPIPRGVDLVGIASLSDNIVDAWRAVGPYRAELDALDEADRRVLVVGRQSIGLYAAGLAAALGYGVDYVDTDPQRLAAAEKLGATVHDRPKPDKSAGALPGHRSHFRRSGGARRDVTCHVAGRCVHRYRASTTKGTVEMPLLPMYTRGVRFVTGRVNARAVIPEVIELLEAGCDLTPAVDRVAPWDAAPDVWPTMTGKTVFTR